MTLHLQPIKLVLIRQNKVRSCGKLLTSQILPFLQLPLKIQRLTRQTHRSYRFEDLVRVAELGCVFSDLQLN
jgi:hypothetical protein